MARLAGLENCKRLSRWLPDEFKYGNQPWNGCSTSSGVLDFSATCRNVRNYKTYAECRETTGLFLGADHRGTWWYCSSLLAGGKLAGEKRQVAELKRSERR